MAEIVFGDGGNYHRPGRPHVFGPELRAAAHYLKAVEEVDCKVREELFETVLGKRYFPAYFIGWQGLRLTPDELTLEGVPGQARVQGEREFERGHSFLSAFHDWLNRYHMWSPFVLDLLYRILQLRDEVRRDQAYLTATIADWTSEQQASIDKEPLTDEERETVVKMREGVDFLSKELEGWGWWVDFLTSDITTPQLDAWLAASGLCRPSVPGSQLLNMPSSPRDAALWIYERLNCVASKTHGVSSLGEVNRELLVRWDRLHVDISWEPSVMAPLFQLITAGWRPEEETWAAAKGRFESAFSQRLKEYRTAMEQRLRSGQLHPRPKDSAKVKWGEPHGWEAVPTKHSDEHFRWLALRQVKGLRPHEISNRPDIQRAVSTINGAIEGTAALLQLDLRPVRPGPPAFLDD